MEHVNAEPLLKLALEWYAEHGPTPIMIETELDLKGEGSVFYSTSRIFYLSESEDTQIQRIFGRLIPVLAGISFGFDSVTLAKIIKHQGVNAQADVLEFGSSDDTALALQCENGRPASQSRIAIEFAKAFDADPDMRAEMIRNAKPYGSASKFLSYTHTSTPDLWPKALIQQNADLIHAPSAPALGIWQIDDCYETIKAPTCITDLPNSDPLTFFDRSGMFTDAVLRKSTDYFYQWEFLLKAASKGHSLHIKMIEAIRDCDDEGFQRLAIRGLLSCIADATTADFTAYEVFTFLAENFGNAPVFSALFESVVFQVNAISLCDYPKHLEYVPDIPCLRESLLENQETLLSRIANELLNKPADHLGLAEYMVFSKVEKMSLPRQQITFIPEDLILHLLASLNTYRSPNPETVDDKIKVDLKAIHGFSSMMRLIQRSHQIDYTSLEHLAERDALVLVNNGLDVRKFTQLSRTARGKVLEAELGL
jgi:hypothetical protein